MDLVTLIILILSGTAVILLTVILILVIKASNDETGKDVLDFQSKLREEILASQRHNRQEITSNVQNSISAMGQIIANNQQRSADQQESRFKTFEMSNEQKMEQIRETMERRISRMQADNNERLDQMREVVDEKLQKTLETKMNESFQIVSDRLEQVYKGLGEMQTLANGVGDLKKVLSNVKTRGILGEIQLGSILSEIMSPDQYDTNVITKHDSTERVEFAVRIPTDNGDSIYMPIDSKFPGDRYAALQEAYENGTADDVKAASALLVTQIKKEAKDIHDKYIDPPNTTDFAIMFLPFEGLYAEVLKQGMVETLQQTYHVNVAGPSTMAALLNSLQMGFRTVAIQKRSGEVWQVLGAVKTEFEKFESTLKETQKKVSQVEKDLDQLVGVRTRSIVRSLRNVDRLDDRSTSLLLDASADLLDLEDDPDQE